jgi:uncharacterized protein YebE (UPF0316 family)
VDRFVDSVTFNWIVIPLLICLARIVDVAIGTLRIIFVSKGMRFLAPLLGFFEVIIWLLAITQIMQNLTNMVNYVAYGAGFALGNFVGIYLESKLSLGFVLLRVITRRSATELIEYFKGCSYRFTIISAESDEGPVNIIYMPLRRKDVSEIVANIKQYNPNAFYTLEDARYVSANVAPMPTIKPRRYRKYRICPQTKKK